MSDQVIPIEKIKTEAIAAAERGFGPGECRYEPESDAAKVWHGAFDARVKQLEKAAA